MATPYGFESHPGHFEGLDDGRAILAGQIQSAGMTRGYRLRITTAFLAISAGLVSYTGLEFMLEAVQKDFSMSADETMVLAQVSSGACLLVVFLVGTLADRFGDRRLLNVACSLFGAGALIVGVAPGPTELLIGQAIAGIGSIGMSIVGLSILAKTFPDPTHRSKAFGLFAVIAPVVAIVMPCMSTTVIDRLNWRWVTVMWIAVSVAAVTLARRCLPARPDVTRRAELLTPTLAGVALSGIALTFSFLRAHASTGDHGFKAVLSASIGVLALIAVVVMMRRMREPSLDFRAVRQPGALPIVLALFVVNGVNLFFFTYLMLQYRYHQSLLETAAILVLPQLTATAGALLGGRLSARWGSARVATGAFAAAAVLSLGVMFAAAESSAWLPVIVLTVAAFPIAGAVGPLTHAFMDLAPADGNAAASSVRNSAVNLGIAIGGLLVGAVVFDDLDADTERTLVAYQQQVDAFHLAGVFCFCAYLGAALLLILHQRRRRSPSLTLQAKS